MPPLDPLSPEIVPADGREGTPEGTDVSELEGALPDAAARAAIRSNLDETLFVEAAAGTGKTTALVSRIVEVLRRGRGTLEDIVAVTFTEKAAGEMKLRLRAEIETARARDGAGSKSSERHAGSKSPERDAGSRSPERDAAPDTRAHLELALEQLELAHIGTIHGFCADLLRERPIEAGVDPAFRVAAEDEAGRLLDRAFERWFERALADPPPGVRRALRRRYARNSGGPREALRRAAAGLVEHRDFTAPWGRPDFDREKELDRAVDLVRELAELAPRARNPRDYLARHLQILARWMRELDLHEEVHGRDYDGLEARLGRLVRSTYTRWNWRGFRDEWFGEGLRKADVLARRDEVRRELEGILDLTDADLAGFLREELRPVVEAYEEIKRREGRLDFVDLLLRARDLLAADDEIRAHYQRRFTHFFVDEFQDTDPLQAEVLLLLCADDATETDFARVRPVPGKLFVVGDPKQSIYRFRRADVMLYERTKRRLAEAGGTVLELTTSFRGQPRLQAAVNGAFARRMTGSEDGSQAEYVPLSGFRDDLPDQPALVALPVPRPYGRYGSVYKRSVEDSLPDAVGAFVDWLLNESGWRVTERERPGEPVPVEPRHVCLLFRRLQMWGEDVTRPYVRALEAREIPHVLVGGRSYFDREEVLAVRNALTAIEWPDDTLAVYGALRGPLFSLGDDALLAFVEEVGALHPLRPRAGEESSEERLPPELRAISEALALLGELHASRNRRPIPETILRLLAAVRAHAGIAIWPTGEQALANVLRLVDRARDFERTGAPSFRAFLDRLEEEAERGQAEEAPIVEEGTEGVRMTTVHRAKGLEFPVVILADMTCSATFDTPSRHVDPERDLWAEPLCGAAPLDLTENLDLERTRERAESDRITYVAATRARDLLVVPALGDGRDGRGGIPAAGEEPLEEPEWWLDALNPAIYPVGGQRRKPGSGSTLGCPSFGAESVLERRDRDGRPLPPPPGSVAPGVHAAEAGNPVVWWDPAALELDVEAPTGERQRRLLEVDEEAQPTLSVEEGIAAHEAWRTRRAERLARGTVPSRRVVTVKALAAIEVHAAAAEEREAAIEERAPAWEVEWIEVPRPPDEERPGGDRFGALVHAALAIVPLGSGVSAGTEAGPEAGAEGGSGAREADAGRAVREADARRAVREADARRAVRAHAPTLGATEEEIEAAVALLVRALEHPLLRRAAAAQERERGDVRREIPLFRPLPDGRILEGVADLAFREPGAGEPGTAVRSRAKGVAGSGRWIIVDYKTDRSPTFAREGYEAQVRLYAEALAAATGEPARGIVLAL